jgi:type III secretion protein V
VIAKGSERIAEVGARFTLDAMPGKQLAIDADLRAGALSVEQARSKRAALERESQFYGAMDGAMKFVKGDAIAGIVIASISLIGGTAIGVGMRDLSFSESLRTYGLLTIGDGLVSQIPSLVISTAAGLVVTRVASEAGSRSLGQDLVAQLLGDARVLWAAAVFLCVLGLVPGLPALPFLVLATLLGVTARARSQQAAGTPPDVRIAPRVEIRLGQALAQRWLAPEAAAALRALCTKRSGDLQATLGVTAGTPTFSADAQLAPMSYAVVLRELPVHREALTDAASLPDALSSLLTELLPRHARELLTLEDVKHRLDALAEHSPTLVRSVVPDKLSIATLADVLRRLLDEHVSVQPLTRILEALGSAAANTKAPELAELARQALRQPIVDQAMHDGVLHVHRLDPLIEDALRSTPALPVDMAQDVIAAVHRARSGAPAKSALVTQADLRRTLFELVSPQLPELPVLGYAEVPPHVLVKEQAPIRV